MNRFKVNDIVEWNGHTFDSHFIAKVIHVELTGKEFDCQVLRILRQSKENIKLKTGMILENRHTQLKGWQKIDNHSYDTPLWKVLNT